MTFANRLAVKDASVWAAAINTVYKAPTKPTSTKSGGNKKTISRKKKARQSRTQPRIPPSPIPRPYRAPPEITLETYRPHEKIDAGVATILQIKLQPVKRNTVSEEKRIEQCTICMEDLFPAPEPKPRPAKRRSIRLNLKRPTISEEPKFLRVVRLLPCGHLFHNRCIGEHVVGEKVSIDNPLTDDDNADQTEELQNLAEDIAGHEFATNSTTFFFERNDLPRPDEDGYIPVPEDETEAVDADAQGLDPSRIDGMIEFAGGWMSLDGERVVGKDTTIIVKCPLCRSHITPSEDQFDYKAKWTKKERKFAKEYFHRPGVPNSAVRLARSGDSATFAKDLENARDFARITVAEARC